MNTKTCHAQGACLALRRCPYCRAPYYPFAPGVIERQPRRRSRAARINVARVVWLLLVLSVMATLTLLLTGGLL